MLTSPYTLIGGPGTTVEIDESMFGKREFLIMIYVRLKKNILQESITEEEFWEEGRCGC